MALNNVSSVNQNVYFGRNFQKAVRVVSGEKVKWSGENHLPARKFQRLFSRAMKGLKIASDATMQKAIRISDIYGNKTQMFP